MDVDTTLLRTFVEIGRSRSFTAAAEKLLVKQPRVSVRVQTLENRLGFALFHRGSRNVALTPQGAQVLEAAIRVLSAMDDLHAVVEQITKGFDRPLKIGSSPLFTMKRWQLLERFLAWYPSSRPRVITTVSEELCAQIRNGTIDIAFIVGEAPPDLEVLKLWSAPYMLMFPANSSLARFGTIEFAQLAGFELSTFAREAIRDLYTQISEAAAPHGTQVLDVIEGSSEAILQYVLEGGHMVICPKWWDECDAPPDEICCRPLAGVDATVDFSVARLSSNESPSARKLWDFIAKTVAAKSNMGDASASLLEVTGGRSAG